MGEVYRAHEREARAPCVLNQPTSPAAALDVPGHGRSRVQRAFPLLRPRRIWSVLLTLPRVEGREVEPPQTGFSIRFGFLTLPPAPLGARPPPRSFRPG